MSYGFAKEGFDIVAGIDNWRDALVTFGKNHQGSKTFLLDLGQPNTRTLKPIADKIDVVIGGPPCQGFSISGKRNPNDPRNLLYQGFVEVVGFFRPRVFVLENVPNLISMARGELKNTIINDFNVLGYDVKCKVLLASDYGVPQNRKRVFFVGVLGRNNFEFPKGKFTEHKLKITCLQALSDLPEGSIADGSLNHKKAQTAYQRSMRIATNKIFNHQITNHEEKTVGIISLVPDGGNYKDLPKHLQNTRNVNIAWTRYSSIKPSLTIDTGHRHHFHYKFNRVPTVRESARLQSFPDNFIFYGSKTSQYKQVGNAVPPLMASQIAKALLRDLEKG